MLVNPKTTPELSVIMAVFNAERTVGRAIRSLLDQTFHDLEIICVDDGSSDGSLAILRDFSDKDRRVKVIAASHAGATSALNAGLDAATGDFVAFLDNDDSHHPRTFELAMAALRDAARDVVVWDWRGIPDETYDGTAFPPVDEHVAVVDLVNKVGWGMGNHHVSFWCKLYRRRILENVRFDPSVIHGDIVFFWKLWMDPTVRAGHLPLTLTHYRERQGSVIHSPVTVEKAIDRVRVIRIIAENVKSNPAVLRRLRRHFFPECLWSVYKLTRRNQELRGSVIPVLKGIVDDGVVQMRAMPLIRAVKLALAFWRG